MSLLKIKNFSLWIKTQIIKGISLQIGEGEIVGLVGETGSGKSLTAESILRLHSFLTEGSIEFDGEELLGRTEKELTKIRGRDIGMMFQDSATAFNPILPIGEQLTEGMIKHLGLSKDLAISKGVDLLFRLGIDHPMARMEQYPHELSIGMRQRILLAMAIACEPRLLIADEPTTSLDVIARSQMLSLIKNLKMGILFITHDLHLISKIASRIYVMSEGMIVEEIAAQSLFEEAIHPITQKLVGSIKCSRSAL